MGSERDSNTGPAAPAHCAGDVDNNGSSGAQFLQNGPPGGNDPGGDGPGGGPGGGGGGGPHGGSARRAPHQWPSPWPLPILRTMQQTIDALKKGKDTHTADLIYYVDASKHPYARDGNSNTAVVDISGLVCSLMLL